MSRHSIRQLSIQYPVICRFFSTNLYEDVKLEMYLQFEYVYRTLNNDGIKVYQTPKKFRGVW